MIMKWLSSLFKQYPNREQWWVLSQSIATGFEAARQEWFEVCVEQIRHYPSGPVGVRLSNAELGGPIVNTLKAFQLISISGFLSGQQYLAKSQLADFCDLYSAQVCGTDIPTVQVQGRELLAVVPDMREFHLARRVAEHLTGGIGVLGETLVLTPFVRGFQLSNCIVVAETFNDVTRVQAIRELMDAWAKQIPQTLTKLFEVAARCTSTAA
jgi:hypothetical protein